MTTPTKRARSVTPPPKEEPIFAKEQKAWPVSEKAMQMGRDFLIDCAKAKQKTVIVPDKDADGLAGAALIYRLLLLLGLPEKELVVHLLRRGTNVHDEVERAALAEIDPRYAIVIDQGSRPGASLVPASAEGKPRCKTLLIDHHEANIFPEHTDVVVNACHHEPVATSATLCYLLGSTLHPDIVEKWAFLCAIGTIGDLGGAFKWEPPFPDFKACFKQHSKKKIGDAVSLLNAQYARELRASIARRSAEFDTIVAWEAIRDATSPDDILSPQTNPHAKRLYDARRSVNNEVERCTHVQPKWSGDSRVALLRITSRAQVHPVIATRWANHLKSNKLIFVMVANDGYTDGMTHFSCRLTRAARAREPSPSIIAMLKEYAGKAPELVAQMGDNFARGHKQASGGIVTHANFEKLWQLMLDTASDEETVSTKRAPAKSAPVQKNTLMGWLQPSPKKMK